MNIQPNIVTKGGDALSTSVTGSAVGAFLSTHQPRWQWKALTRDGTTYSAYGTLGLFRCLVVVGGMVVVVVLRRGTAIRYVDT